MGSKEKISKFKRTTQEQLQLYIMFCKQHPELQRKKQTSPHKLQMLWSELAETLNALKGPTRTATKWKETLTHWKHQLRSRARKDKAHPQITGGDPPAVGVSECEVQESSTFETATVDGVPSSDHQVLSPLDTTTDTVPAPSPSPVSAPAFPAIYLRTLPSSPSPPTSPPLIEYSPDVSHSRLSPPIPPSPTPSTSASVISEAPKPTAVKMLGKVLKKLKAHERREERAISQQQKILEQNEQLMGVLMQMTRERREELQKTSEQNLQLTGVLSQMTQALTAMTTVLNNLTEKLNH
ncbi:afadin-like [Bactrocera tryoni]|uniref:afadin-like n=1 Tax=Bactrocera tryoni TaxID=59916 RepID=UPI001A9811D9|nr:afadin-like [Bactrocera tryoni]